MTKHTIRNRWIGAGIAAALTAGGGIAFAAAANAAPEASAHGAASTAAIANPTVGAPADQVPGEVLALTPESAAAAGAEWRDSVNIEGDNNIDLNDADATLPEGVFRADSVSGGVPSGVEK